MLHLISYLKISFSLEAITINNQEKNVKRKIKIKNNALNTFRFWKSKMYKGKEMYKDLVENSNRFLEFFLWGFRNSSNVLNLQISFKNICMIDF